MSSRHRGVGGLRFLHFLLTLTPTIISLCPDSHECDSPVMKGSSPCLPRPHSRQLPNSPRLHTHTWGQFWNSLEVRAAGHQRSLVHRGQAGQKRGKLLYRPHSMLQRSASPPYCVALRQSRAIPQIMRIPTPETRPFLKWKESNFPRRETTGQPCFPTEQ